MNARGTKIIAIVGPTASGKSELAVKIALRLGSRQAKRRFNINGAEIISADSRQVYKGLNIGTGKVAGRWKKQGAMIYRYIVADKKPALNTHNQFIYKGIPHHCIDFTSPKKLFTVVDFKKCAQNAIKDITSRGKIPILCGGTGFYIDAVLYDLPIPDVPPNWKLRAELSKKSTAELFLVLKKLDPKRAKTIDPHNPRRLIRAIEIVKTAHRLIPPIPRLSLVFKAKPWNSLILGIKIPREKLYKRIDQRLKQRLKQGMIREVKNLLKKGVSHKRLQSLGLEYRFISLYLQKKLTYEEMAEKLKNAIHQYAKRQITWFRRNKDIHWIQSNQKTEKRVMNLSRQFLKN